MYRANIDAVDFESTRQDSASVVLVRLVIAPGASGSIILDVER